MRYRYRLRRVVVGVVMLGVAAVLVAQNPDFYALHSSPQFVENRPNSIEADSDDAYRGLTGLPIKGRAPKTNYSRDQFGNGWLTEAGCDTRNQILYRDLDAVKVDDACKVLGGMLEDPYTGSLISFSRGVSTSALVQVDHVVALSDAWQKGAQQLSTAERIMLANDPLELLAVEGAANQQKSDGDAATWLPPNKAFRCEYVARQIAVKQKYRLWITEPEFDAMKRVLNNCPNQKLPVANAMTKIVL